MQPNDTQPTPTPAPAPVPSSTSTNGGPVNAGAGRQGGGLVKSLLLVVVVLVLAGGAGYGGYAYGYPLGTKAQKKVDDAALPKPVEVPKDATIIAQCAVGRGTQYAKPSDIPQGPVYNVYQGKVIGLEFMLGKDDLINSNKSYLDLPLMGQTFDHINVGLLSQGHAGYPQPHYHVDLYNVPASVSKTITCK